LFALLWPVVINKTNYVRMEKYDLNLNCPHGLLIQILKTNINNWPSKYWMAYKILIFIQLSGS